MPPRYPIFLDITDRRAVIIGGGAVAARKAAALLDAGCADVRIYAPDIDPKMPEQVSWSQAEYHPDQLDDADLVFAATNNPDINDAVMRDAKNRNILANRADTDDASPGDFITPARLTNGPVTVAVAANSAALAAAIRDRIADSLDPRLIQMARAMTELRPMIRDRAGLDPATRRDVFRALTTEAALTVLDKEGLPALKAWLAGRFPQWTPH